MILADITTQDWVSLSVGIAGALVAYFSQKDRLPSWMKKWLSRVGIDNIYSAVESVAAIAELTPAQRREQAVIYVQKLCVKELGFSVPTSIANLLVEYIYQQWKKARG